MVGKKHLLIAVVLALLITMPDVLAYSPTITIYTDYPSYGLILRVKNPDNGQLLETLYPRLDSTGKAVGSYNTSKPSLDFTIVIVKNGDIVTEEDFEGRATSQNIELDMRVQVANVTNQTNQTSPQNATNLTVINQSQNPSVTGAVISKVKGVSSFVWYVIVGFLVAAICIFFIARKYNSKSRAAAPPSPPSTPPGSKIQSSQSPKSAGTDIEAELRDAEEKIRQAQEDLNSVRNREKVYEAERRFQQAKDELERLKGSS